MQCAFHRKIEGIAAPRTCCWNPLRPNQRFKHEHRLGVQTDSCQLKKVLWLFTEDKFKWKMSPQNEAKKVHDTFISKQDILSTHTRAHTSVEQLLKGCVTVGCLQRFYFAFESVCLLWVALWVDARLSVRSHVFEWTCTSAEIHFVTFLWLK